MAFVRKQTQKCYNTLFVTVPTDEVSNYYIDWKRRVGRRPVAGYCSTTVYNVIYNFYFFFFTIAVQLTLAASVGCQKSKTGDKIYELIVCDWCRAIEQSSDLYTSCLYYYFEARSIILYWANRRHGTRSMQFSSMRVVRYLIEL